MAKPTFAMEKPTFGTTADSPESQEIFCSPNVPDTLQLIVLIVLLTLKHNLTNKPILTSKKTGLSLELHHLSREVS